MRKLALSLLLIHFLVMSYGQKYFSKVTTPSQFICSSTITNFEFKNDTLCFISNVLTDVHDSSYYKAYFMKYSSEGSLLSADSLGTSSINAVFIDSNRILTIGRFRKFESDSLQLMVSDGAGFSQKLQLWNPYGYQKDWARYPIVEFNGQYLILCSGHEGYNTNEIRPYIYWINKDFTIDSLMQIPFSYGEILEYGYGIDKDGHLNITMTYHSDSGNNIRRKDYLGYIKINEKKEIIHSFFMEREPFQIFSPKPRATIYPDGMKVITCNKGERTSTWTIIALDKDDNVLWRDTTYYDMQEDHIKFTRCANGDLLVMGHNTLRGFIDSTTIPFRTTYIERIDKYGNNKFYKSYGSFAKTGFTNGNWLYDIKEKSPTSIYAVGTIRTPDEHAIYGKQIINDSTWILHIDSLGCIDRDKCNDYYAWKTPEGLFVHDQINMRHKEWYVNKDGREVVQYFGVDTAMVERKTKWNRYRPIISRDVATGKETVDTLYTAWQTVGKLYIYGLKDCYVCDGPVSVLYDFSLNVNDTFKLPYNYGLAKVIEVDTFRMIPGYNRKRIVLEHLNPVLKAKYGNLTWIEGIGSLNGLIYFNDWKDGTTTELMCYYDRGEKRYQAKSEVGCKPVTKPEFGNYGPYCEGSQPDILLDSPLNDKKITGSWYPEKISTAQSGIYQYVFTPDFGLAADTTSIYVTIVAKTTPEFNIKQSYKIQAIADILPATSSNGIKGIWSPAVINTEEPGDTRYTFTPEAGECAAPLILDISIFSDIDTTDMDSNTVWYSSYFIGDWDDCNTKLATIRVVRDTLIDNRLARVIGITRDGQYYPDSEIPLYSKDGKMFFYEDDNWWLLYDFTAQVGDTITYYVSKKHPYYFLLKDFYPFVNDGEFSKHQLTIFDIDTVYTEEGKPLKRFHTTFIGTDANRMEYIIERLGSVYQLFGENIYHIGYYCPDGGSPELRCYIDDDIFFKLTDDQDCDIISAVTDVSLGSIAIYPNPANDKLEISMAMEISKGDYNILNIQGNVLMSGHFTDNRQIELDISHLPSGMYFVSILKDDSILFVKKFVKQ